MHQHALPGIVGAGHFCYDSMQKKVLTCIDLPGQNTNLSRQNTNLPGQNTNLILYLTEHVIIYIDIDIHIPR